MARTGAVRPVVDGKGMLSLVKVIKKLLRNQGLFYSARLIYLCSSSLEINSLASVRLRSGGFFIYQLKYFRFIVLMSGFAGSVFVTAISCGASSGMSITH
jgi:hypothetical protein